MGTVTEIAVENFGERSTDVAHDFNFGMQFDVYRWAVGMGIEGKSVADVGSGTGYGSCLFAKHGAARINSFEISEEAIAYSRERSCDFSQITYHQANLNLPLNFPEKHDIVFSSNVFEHLTDLKTAFENVFNLMKSEGKFVFAIPCINTSQRLSAELMNQYHFTNLSIKFWQQTLRKCFSSVKTYAQAVLTDEHVYNSLTASEKAIKDSNFSTFVEILGTPGFDEMQQFVFGYANIAFVCESPNQTVGIADFIECPISSIREMAWTTDPIRGWTSPLRQGEKVAFPLKVTGWIGGLQVYIGDCGTRGAGPIEIRLEVRNSDGELTQNRRTLLTVESLEVSKPSPFAWNMYREPIFVPTGGDLSISFQSYAYGESVFNIALGTDKSDHTSESPILAWVFSLLAPLPQRTELSDINL